jgi:hypothetical protein
MPRIVYTGDNRWESELNSLVHRMLNHLQCDERLNNIECVLLIPQSLN